MDPQLKQLKENIRVAEKRCRDLEGRFLHLLLHAVDMDKRPTIPWEEVRANIFAHLDSIKTAREKGEPLPGPMHGPKTFVEHLHMDAKEAYYDFQDSLDDRLRVMGQFWKWYSKLHIKPVFHHVPQAEREKYDFYSSIKDWEPPLR